MKTYVGMPSQDPIRPSEGWPWIPGTNMPPASPASDDRSLQPPTPGTAVRSLLRAGVICALLTACLACLPRIGKAAERKAEEGTPALSGIRPGMNRSQAQAALKAAHPELRFWEGFTAPQSQYGIQPRSWFRPANVAALTALLATDKSQPEGSTAFEPDCQRDKGSMTVVKVLLSPEPREQKVVLVDEYRRYCGPGPTTDAEIDRLRRQFGAASVRQYRIGPDGKRILPEEGMGTLADPLRPFLEWYYGEQRQAAVSALERLLGPPQFGGWGTYENVGLSVPGTLVHTEIGSADRDYVSSIRTLYWNPAAMKSYYRRLDQLLAEYDRIHLGIGQLENAEALARVQLPPAPEDPLVPAPGPAPAAAPAPPSPLAQAARQSAMPVLAAPVERPSPQPDVPAMTAGQTAPPATAGSSQPAPAPVIYVALHRLALLASADDAQPLLGSNLKPVSCDATARLQTLESAAGFARVRTLDRSKCRAQGVMGIYEGWVREAEIGPAGQSECLLLSQIKLRC